jgi:hypothetical protein
LSGEQRTGASASKKARECGTAARQLISCVTPPTSMFKRARFYG